MPRIPKTSEIAPNKITAIHWDTKVDQVEDPSLGHNHSGSVAGGKKVSHNNLINISTDQHHPRQHDHSDSADGKPIALVGVPDLPASKITSGIFSLDRIPDILMGKDADTLDGEHANNLKEFSKRYVFMMG